MKLEGVFFRKNGKFLKYMNIVVYLFGSQLELVNWWRNLSFLVECMEMDSIMPRARVTDGKERAGIGKGMILLANI